MLPLSHDWLVALQHPFGQLPGVHTQVPFWHSVFGGHVMHAAPEVPQAVFVLPCLQVWVVASQQPELQLVALQTQDPFWHSEPAGQLTQTTPLVPHAAFVFPP